MVTATATRASNYDEAYELFVAWRPETKERQGANGMTFEYLPTLEYKKFLDATVGPGNWQSFVETGTKAIGVRIEIFGVSKSSTSDIWPSAKIKKMKADVASYVENPQPNEANKAEARAFRRAAADHGLLRHLWDRDSDSHDEEDRPSRRPSFPPRSSGKSSGGSSTATEGQVNWLTKSVERGGFGVPKTVAMKLTKGSATQLIDALKAASGEEGYEEDPTPYIRKALKKIAPDLVAKLSEVDVEDDEDDEDED